MGAAPDPLLEFGVAMRGVIGPNAVLRSKPSKTLTRGGFGADNPSMNDAGKTLRSGSGASGAGGGAGGGGQRGRTKVLSMPQLLERRRGARAMGLRVVQCHGCFDIVHPGHIRHLRQAKSHGDILLVTITGDSSFAKRGGAPLIPEDLRAENLAELDCVDWVHIEQSKTAEELLKQVEPDVYIKGREYEHNNDPRFLAERSVVENAGGRVVYSSGDVVFSSTALIGALERSVDPYHARLTQLLGSDELDGVRINQLISGFRGRRVLVVGETICDVYTHCDQPDVASESPVLTLRPLQERRYDGAAAIIALHLAAMGAKPVLLTGLPQQPTAMGVRQRLEQAGVEVHSITTDTALAEKQRFLVGPQKVMKVNRFEPIVLDAARQDELVELSGELAKSCEGAIITDFGNGLLSAGIVERMCAAVRPRVNILTGDVSGRRASLTSFRGADLLCPSEREARETLRLFDESLPAVAWELTKLTSSRAVALTMGSDGLIAFDPLADAEGGSGDVHRSRMRGQHIPALSGYPVDPLGCGDAMLAAATLSLCAGGTLLMAMFAGSLAAAVEAQRLGNVAVSAADLRSALVRIGSARLAYSPVESGSVAPASTHAAARVSALVT